MTLVTCTPFRLVNVNVLMQNFSTSHVLRTSYFRPMPHAPQLIRVGLSCATVSQTFPKIDVEVVSLTMFVLRRTVFFLALRHHFALRCFRRHLATIAVIALTHIFSSYLLVHGTPDMTPEKKGKYDKLKNHLIGSIDLSSRYPTTDVRPPSHRDQGQFLGS